MNKFETVANRLGELMNECDRDVDALIQTGKEFGRNELLVSITQFVVIDGYGLDEALGMATPEFGYNPSNGEWAQDGDVWQHVFGIVIDEVPGDTEMDDILELAWKILHQEN